MKRVQLGVFVLVMLALALGSAVQFWGGWPFYRGALLALHLVGGALLLAVGNVAEEVLEPLAGAPPGGRHP